MARTLHRLSAIKIKTAKEGMHCDGGGLYLQVIMVRRDVYLRLALTLSIAALVTGALHLPALS